MISVLSVFLPVGAICGANSRDESAVKSLSFVITSLILADYTA